MIMGKRDFNLLGMRVAVRTTISALALAVAAPGSAMDVASDRATVLDVDQRRAAAFVTNDVAFLESVTGEGYTHVETSGVARTRAGFLAERRSGTPRFKRFDIERNDVRVLGDIAIVSGRYANQIQTAAGVQPVKRARHLRVYARRNGKWRAVARQATATP